MEKPKKVNIPTEEEFARAKASMRERDLGLSSVRESVLSEFKSRFPLHDLYIFSGVKDTFHPVILFKTERDVELAMSNGSVDALCEAIALGLEREGRGDRAQLVVVPEIDSDENVHARFNGNYFYRLR